MSVAAATRRTPAPLLSSPRRRSCLRSCSCSSAGPLLGVHYLSDVLGAWALGITRLGISAFAFELSRQQNRR